MDDSLSVLIEKAKGIVGGMDEAEKAEMTDQHREGWAPVPGEPTTKWLKWPGPGEIRGEGQWRTIQDWGCSEETWRFYRDTQYVPTFEGDAPPDG